ncbi:non-heme iron oxygenase ferredoxin subunit [Crossiella sp. CA-258035]|uniref:Rieske (2Fe-2S) protein n=1 Tax=Crossiella sp. CA-258035 TaxID=2981138 RepID=UPI0024BCA405|nr:non-heme iron oxygenase ferredoxin subunit [Crossiella sp. CA-258035]WHT22208.1 non-heme iron oxygenase ferredoxin subunit [Crossiella sp. CA-258035]
MTEFRVCPLAELADGKPYGTEVDGTPVVLVRLGEQVHALHDVCSHAEVTLSDGGEVSDGAIECWLHGAGFDLCTGEPLTPPASDPIDVYAVSVREGEVYVDPATPTNR